MTESTVTSTVAVTINGAAIDAHPGELLIAAAERHGVFIPRFCYHPRMKSVGMCRQCLVEVDSGRGMSLQPSCMVTVSDDMVVETESDAAKRAQEGMLELLLVNHPLDCPVCDKGGECPLQDQTLAFGPGETRMIEEKRHFEKPIPISDLVFLDRERCILCDRCTRFATDIAGDPLIQFGQRGNQMQVITFPDDPFNSHFSGNTVQICPVGALTAKPYRFRARPWDLEEIESTCTTCSVGCRVAVQSSRNELLRYQGVDIDAVNHGWLCDRGRFDFESVSSGHRLTVPMLRNPDNTDELVETDWNTALDAAAGALEAGNVGIIGGARLTNEDAYAWSKLARSVIGTDNVDAQLGDGLPAEMVLSLAKATIEETCAADTVLVIGPDLKEELPVLFLRLRGAAVDHAIDIVEISVTPTGLTPYTHSSHRYAPGSLGQAVEDVLDAAPSMASGNVVVVVGRANLASNSDEVAEAVGVLDDRIPSARYLTVLRRGNVMGALDMGLSPGLLPGRVSLEAGRDCYVEAWGSLPSEAGLDTAEMLQAAASGQLDTLVLLGADPLADVPDRDLVDRALSAIGTLIAIDGFPTASVRRADIVLPAVGYAEKSGTTTNIEGRVSRLGQLVTPPGTARPDWMIAVELAVRLGGDLGFESPAEIWNELSELAPSHLGCAGADLDSDNASEGVVLPLPGTPTLDKLTWEAPPLGDPAPADSYALRLFVARSLYDMATATAMSPSIGAIADDATLSVHPVTLDRLGVNEGDVVKVTSSRATMEIPLTPNDSVPAGIAVMGFNQAGHNAAELIDLGSRSTDIQLETR